MSGELRIAELALLGARAEADRAIRGSGLGLTGVRRIAAAAGGGVSAEQREPRGVRVVVRQPLA